MAVYSIEGSSENCYFGTTVLINKLDIRNQSELDKAEKQITLLRAIQAEQNMILEKPNFQFFKDIHKFLFDDIYESPIRSSNSTQCNYNKIALLYA